MKTRSRPSSLMTLYIIGIGAFLVLPQVIIFAVAFSEASFVSFPPPGYSFRWMSKVISDPSFMKPLWNSVVLGFQSAALAAVLALPASIALVRHRFVGARAIQNFLLSPLSMPTLILGIALLFFLNDIGLGNTYAGLLFGHVVIVLPYLVRTIVAVYAGTDASIEEAAYTLGAGRLATFWYVTLPMLRPAVFAGGMFAFLISFDEVAVALLLSNANSVTLPVSILSYLVYNYDPAVAAISVIKMIIVVLALLLLERVYGLQNLTIQSGSGGK